MINMTQLGCAGGTNQLLNATLGQGAVMFRVCVFRSLKFNVPSHEGTVFSLKLMPLVNTTTKLEWYGTLVR